MANQLTVDTGNDVLRVALALPDLVGGGAERVFLDIARGLLARGAEVDVVVVRDGGALRPLVPDGARTVVLGTNRALSCVPRLAGYLRAERPAAVVSALSHMNLATIAAGHLVRPPVPVVVTQHNHLSTCTANARTRRDRFMPRLIHLAYPYADGIVAVSRGVAHDLATVAGLRPSSVNVVYNPVVFDRVAAAGDAPIEHPWPAEGTKAVLGIGRLVDQKDFITLIRAFSRLPPYCGLVILGEGERRPMLEDLARDLGVTDRVFLPGFVANPYPAMRAADCFVLSSRWEGLPTVLIEALTFETPIVATDCHSGPAEILDGGKWGRLVPVGDPVRLAAAIDAALAAPRVDRAEARGRFRLETVTQQYINMLPGRGKPNFPPGGPS